MLTRHEAERACRHVRNLWPRDESEALRYRRQVVLLSPASKGMISKIHVTRERSSCETQSGAYGHERFGYPDTRIGPGKGGRVPKGYALVEWLAPDGRCADHGDAERHWEHHVEPIGGGEWALTRNGYVKASCNEADRFRGHEDADAMRWRQDADGRWVEDGPCCGEYHLMPGLVRADYHEGEGLRLYKAPRRPDGSILAVPVPRERLTAEHPDHARRQPADATTTA